MLREYREIFQSGGTDGLMDRVSGGGHHFRRILSAAVLSDLFRNKKLIRQFHVFIVLAFIEGKADGDAKLFDLPAVPAAC